MRRWIWVCALLPSLAWAGAKVSNFSKVGSKTSNAFGAGAALDGKPETAWLVPGESENKGEWIELDLPAGTVDKLVIWNGRGESEDVWKDYARVKEAKIDIYTLDENLDAKVISSTTVTFTDKNDFQTVDLPDTKVGSDMSGGKLRLTVTDIYAGSDFPNLALSEVYAVLKEMDVEAVQIGEAAGNKEALSDKSPKTVWSAPAAGASFTVTAGGWGLSSIGFQAPATKDMARPKVVELRSGARTITATLADNGSLQWVQAPAFNGYNGGANDDVVVTIKEVYPGTKSKDTVALVEVKARATSFSSF